MHLTTLSTSNPPAGPLICQPASFMFSPVDPGPGLDFLTFSCLLLVLKTFAQISPSPNHLLLPWYLSQGLENIQEMFTEWVNTYVLNFGEGMELLHEESEKDDYNLSSPLKCIDF